MENGDIKVSNEGVSKHPDRMKIRVSKYRNTQYWAVWLNEELLAVTVYKKGTVAVSNVLSEALNQQRG